MKVFAKTEYACIAVLELAQTYDSGDPVRIRDIADQHGIPSRFLVQILLQLKGAGLVASTRGAAGGYQLVRSPDEITLGEVMGTIDGNEPINTSTSSDSPISRVLLRAWRTVAAKEHEMLKEITFADLVARLKGEVEQMYYI
ncbi:MAG: Rrf2 family transcriptional regulator [Planctomycetota bacterium]|nr:Rrf2 family transcriptional regulator [Planctomycetota bacterium]